jgi:hypothetical protein
MLALFCLRLACGVAAAPLVLVGQPIGPRFVRTQLLIVLGLSVVAALVLWPDAPALRLPLGLAVGLAFAGAVVWSLPTPWAGWGWVGLTAAALVAALVQTAPAGGPVNDLSAAALLGTALTAMLMGHFYLIAPTMSLTPLVRLLRALFAALAVRAMVALAGLWSWTADHSLANLRDETVLLLPVRWGLGLVAPLILGWMAWQATRLRATQSATGILYVLVAFCLLGELVSQLLGQTGFPL